MSLRYHLPLSSNKVAPMAFETNMSTPRFVWIAATLLAIFVGVFGQVSQKSAETATGTVVETSVGSPLPTSTQSCNGHASFCTRSYGNITYVGTHNSPFVKEGSVSANQDLDVTQQLTDGVRMCELMNWFFPLVD